MSKLGCWLGEKYVWLMSRIKGERTSAKGEMLIQYCQDILNGSDRYIECYEDVVKATMEANNIDRMEACDILSRVLGAMR